MNIGFVGVGSMGQAMIALLVQAGHRVSAWNRSADALAGLSDIDVDTFERRDGQWKFVSRRFELHDLTPLKEWVPVAGSEHFHASS